MKKYRHYVVSDLHLLHSNIIKYCNRSEYDADSAESCIKMSWDIVRSIKQQIPDEEDVVLWNLGDLFYGPLFTAQTLDYIKLFVCEMKGLRRKLNIVLGNHDKEFKKFVNWGNWRDINKTDSLKQIFTYLGFNHVYDLPVIFSNDVILSHEPYFLKPNSQFYNVHGHTHNFDVDSEYFTRTLENSKMVLQAYLISGREPPSCEEKENKENWIVNPKMYKNVCWDASQGKVLDLENICKELQNANAVK